MVFKSLNWRVGIDSISRWKNRPWWVSIQDLWRQNWCASSLSLMCRTLIEQLQLKTDTRELESELWHWKDIDICLMMLLCAKDSRKGKMSMVWFGKWDAQEVVGSISEETHDQRGTVGREICQTGKHKYTVFVTAGQNKYFALVLSFIIFYFMCIWW